MIFIIMTGKGRELADMAKKRKGNTIGALEFGSEWFTLVLMALK